MTVAISDQMLPSMTQHGEIVIQVCLEYGNQDEFSSTFWTKLLSDTKIADTVKLVNKGIKAREEKRSLYTAGSHSEFNQFLF